MAYSLVLFSLSPESFFYFYAGGASFSLSSSLPSIGSGEQRRANNSLRQVITSYFHYNGLTRLSTCLIQSCGSNITGKSPSAMKDHLVIQHPDICHEIVRDFGEDAFDVRG